MLHNDIKLGRCELAKLRKEVEVHAKLNYPHVVQLLGACTVDPTKRCIVMELAPRGSLYEVLRNSQVCCSLALCRNVELAHLWKIIMLDHCH